VREAAFANVRSLDALGDRYQGQDAIARCP